MSKKISMGGESCGAPSAKHPNAAEIEFDSMNQNQSLFTPLMPAQMGSGSQSMTPGGDWSLRLQQVETPTPGISRWMLAYYRVNNKESKPSDLIAALRGFMHYPEKDSASTLAGVMDYIHQTKGEIQQLDEKLYRLRLLQQSQSAGVQSQDTTAQHYDMAGSPVSGLVEMPNQMEGTDHHDISEMGIPADQSAEAVDDAVAMYLAVDDADAMYLVVDDASAMYQSANQAADVAAREGSGKSKASA
ncbi:uncharacterized protein LOC141700787 isoform X2 [Apium graveolens]|uniref:uncharacterized protein LOC141700787 isoform X2 n=1 Tax=Apium graveolens TaxID=4045 RepID=UPI003D7A66F7